MKIWEKQRRRGLLQVLHFLFAVFRREQLPASQHPQARVNWCQTTFPSPPVVSQMFLVRISVSGAATQTCWQLPNGDTVTVYVSAKLRKAALLLITDAIQNTALLSLLLAGRHCAVDHPADYSETWVKKIMPFARVRGDCFKGEARGSVLQTCLWDSRTERGKQ